MVPVIALAIWDRLPKVWPFQAKPSSRIMTRSSRPFHSRTSSAPAFRCVLDPYRDSAAEIEKSDLDYTILRPGWFSRDKTVSYKGGVVLQALASMSASFERFCLAAGLETLSEMLEQDATAACGERHERGERCQAHRWGRTKGKIGFHGGKVEIERPRVRGLDGVERVLPCGETEAGRFAEPERRRVQRRSDRAQDRLDQSAVTSACRPESTRAAVRTSALALNGSTNNGGRSPGC